MPSVVARIYDPRRAEIFQRLGIPTVPTVAWTIDHVLRRIIPTLVALLVVQLHNFVWSTAPSQGMGGPPSASTSASRRRIRVVAVARTGMPALDSRRSDRPRR